jgi:ABC-type multidrug transport system fused ATPase/permease subunit
VAVPADEEAKLPAVRYGRLAPYITRQWPSLLAIVVLSGLTSLAAALQPLPMKVLVDYALGGQELPPAARAALERFSVDPSPKTLAIAAALGSVGFFALGSLFQVALTLVWSAGGRRMVYELTVDLFHRLQRLSLAFCSRQPVGDSIGRLFSDTWCVYTLTAGLMSPGQHMVTLASTGFVAWKLDPYLAALTLAMAPFLAVSSRYFGNKLKGRARLGREAQSRLMSFVQQTLTAIPLVQAFSREDLNRRHFEHLSSQAVMLSQKGVLLNSTSGLVNGIIITIGSSIVLFAGGQRVISGVLSLGTLLVFLSYSRSMQKAAEGLLTTYSNLKPVEASIERVLEILDLKEAITEPAQPVPVPIGHGRAGAHLRLECVTFGYEPGTPVLRDISMDIRPGETLALVGESGAGKSTLVSLIPRFIDPWSGTVTLNGIDVRTFAVRTLREQVAIVLQEPFLFPMTVAENIGYGRPGATRDEIIAAASNASADEFIRLLPDGYDTRLGERGATLSGGQRQRLSIARAFLKNAPILILDEPTSALDAETEALLLDALDRLTAGRTTLIIAHRLSTVRRADRIAVLEGGRLAECGTRAELLGSAGVFQRLHALQFVDSPRTVAV